MNYCPNCGYELKKAVEINEVNLKPFPSPYSIETTGESKVVGTEQVNFYPFPYPIEVLNAKR